MRRNNQGFTLFELIVVMCLVAIVSAFAITGIWKAVPGIALKSAANDLVSDMRLARSLAVKNQETVTMSFNTDSGLYQISSNSFSKTVNLNDSRGGVRFGAGMAAKQASSDGDPFPADFSYVSFQGDISFLTNGMCNRSGYVYLCNENNDMAYAAGITSMAGVVVFKKTGGEDSWTTL